MQNGCRSLVYAHLPLKEKKKAEACLEFIIIVVFGFRLFLFCVFFLFFLYWIYLVCLKSLDYSTVALYKVSTVKRPPPILRLVLALQLASVHLCPVLVVHIVYIVETLQMICCSVSVQGTSLPSLHFILGVKYRRRERGRLQHFPPF